MKATELFGECRVVDFSQFQIRGIIRTPSGLAGILMRDVVGEN